MKKVMFGFIIGIIVSFSSTILANSEIVAKVTSFNFEFNGDKKIVNTQPLVVDGTSYLPVREIATLFGYDVDYNSETKTISFTNNGDSSTSQSDVQNSETENDTTNQETSREMTEFEKNLLLEAKENNFQPLEDALENNKDFNVDAQLEETKETLLMLAVVHGEPFMANDILKYGANTDIQNKEGRTAVHLSLIHGVPEILPVLIYHFDASVLIKDNDGKKPIDYSEEDSTTRSFLEIQEHKQTSIQESN